MDHGVRSMLIGIAIPLGVWTACMAAFLRRDYSYAMKHNSAAHEWEATHGRS